MKANTAEQTNLHRPVLSDAAIKVRDALINSGLETPMIDNGLTNEEKYQRIKHSFEDIVTTLGLDLSDDSLAETPHRIAKMYVKEIFQVWIMPCFLRSPSLKTRCK